MRFEVLSALLLLGSTHIVVGRRVLDAGSLDISVSENEKRDAKRLHANQDLTIEELGKDKREPKRLPLDIDEIIDESLGSKHQREAKRLPLDVENIIDESLKSNHKRDAKRVGLTHDSGFEFDGKKKRDIKRPQFVIDLTDGRVEDRVYLDSRLAILQDISFFSKYGRDVRDVVSQLEDGSQELIVIAPTNEAISTLRLKPWQFPKDIDAMEQNKLQPQQIDEAISDNIAHFVKSHIVAHAEDFNSQSNELWLHSEADNSKKGDIVIKKDGNEYYVASASDMDYKLVKMVDVAANGVILVIDSSLVNP